MIPPCRELPVGELQRLVAGLPPVDGQSVPDPRWRRVVVCLSSDPRPGVVKAARGLARRLEAALAEHRRLVDMYEHERKLWSLGYQAVAGVDEAGRGPLAGPVVAAAVIMAPGTHIPGVDDSKALSAAQRQTLYPLIRQRALAVGIAGAGPAYIDRHNIHQATLYAMRVAITRTGLSPDHLLVDAVRLPVPIPQWSLVHGDALSASIAAASIVAKVTRDRLMNCLDRRYPQYGFAAHKGYATPEHLERLARYGPCAAHRYSFAPVRLAGQLAQGR